MYSLIICFDKEKKRKGKEIPGREAVSLTGGKIRKGRGSMYAVKDTSTQGAEN